VIVDPLNDAECLGQLTAIASEGTTNPEIKTLAARFRSTKALAKWIRGLPQRDDTGEANDGPRVMCDVGQRARAWGRRIRIAWSGRSSISRQPS
jgi:hypothetical protein